MDAETTTVSDISVPERNMFLSGTLPPLYCGGFSVHQKAITNL